LGLPRRASKNEGERGEELKGMGRKGTEKKCGEGDGAGPRESKKDTRENEATGNAREGKKLGEAGGKNKGGLGVLST